MNERSLARGENKAFVPKIRQANWKRLEQEGVLTETEERFQREIEGPIVKSFKRDERRLILWNLRENNKAGKGQDLDQLFKSWGIRRPKINRLWVEEKYSEVVARKEKESPEECKISPAEDVLYPILKRLTKRQIFRQVWIGNSCFDFFIPSIYSPRERYRPLRGFLIEVNGKVHRQTQKMKKDFSKLDTAKALSIMATSITDRNVGKAHTANYLKNVLQSRPLDAQGSKILWGQIHLGTVVTLAEDSDFRRWFGLSVRQFRFLRSQILKKKKARLGYWHRTPIIH